MWRKFGLTQTSNWKRGSILIAILGHCGYSSLILYQTSTSDSFLIVSLNVEPKTITLKSISLSHNSNFVTLCIGLLENTRPLKCWHFHYTVSKKKLHLFISLMTSLEKSISIVKLWASWGQMQVFQNSNFHLKAHILPFAINTVLFPLKCWMQVSHFWEKCLQNTQVSQSFFHINMVFHGKAASWACNANNHRSAFPQEPEFIDLKCKFLFVKYILIIVGKSRQNITIITNSTASACQGRIQWLPVPFGATA